MNLNPEPYDPEEWEFNQFGYWLIWMCGDGACPVCREHMGPKYEPATEPQMPPEGCTCVGGCQSWYERLPIQGPPGEMVLGAVPWYDTTKVLPPEGEGKFAVWMEYGPNKFVRGFYEGLSGEAEDRGMWIDFEGKTVPAPAQWMPR
jgi:hypothetical protein